jgi:hypothetical protein
MCSPGVCFALPRSHRNAEDAVENLRPRVAPGRRIQTLRISFRRQHVRCAREKPKSARTPLWSANSGCEETQATPIGLLVNIPLDIRRQIAECLHPLLLLRARHSRNTPRECVNVPRAEFFLPRSAWRSPLSAREIPRSREARARGSRTIFLLDPAFRCVVLPQSSLSEPFK